MKHLGTMLLLLAAAPLAASAQSIIVVDKDGTSHKFNADYVKDVHFVEVTPVAPAVDFTSIDLTVYSQGNVLITLANGDDSTKLELDTYGPTTAVYLMPGSYVVGGSGDYRIDLGSYTKVKVDGESKTLKSGTMTVANEGKEYTISVDFEMSDGTTLQGEYKGALPTYSPVVEMTMSAASYNENPQAAGEFYVKMNDADWKVEMALDFFADTEATVLPAGEYTYSADNTPGTFSQKSYVDFYNPYSTNKMKGGTVNVAQEEGKYTITMNLELEDGRVCEFTYTGKITGEPTFN